MSKKKPETRAQLERSRDAYKKSYEGKCGAETRRKALEREIRRLTGRDSLQAEEIARLISKQAHIYSMEGRRRQILHDEIDSQNILIVRLVKEIYEAKETEDNDNE